MSKFSKYAGNSFGMGLTAVFVLVGTELLFPVAWLSFSSLMAGLFDGFIRFLNTAPAAILSVALAVIWLEKETGIVKGAMKARLERRAGARDESRESESGESPPDAA